MKIELILREKEITINYNMYNYIYIPLLKVVLENSCRADEHDCPFARASIELTNMLCDILKVGEMREYIQTVQTVLFKPRLSIYTQQVIQSCLIS